MKTIILSGAFMAMLIFGACSNDDPLLSTPETEQDATMETVTADGYILWDGSVKIPSIDEQTKTASINSAAELAGLASLVNAGNSFAGYCFTLTNNIDLADNEWTPIGQGRRSCICYNGTPFAGVFDGNGKTIRGLDVKDVESKDGAGLFAAVSGTVKNLNFAEVNITESTADQTGTVTGMLLKGGVIENVNIISGNVSGTSGVGAIAGRLLADGTVRECTNEANVKGGSSEVGGIVGAAYYTSTGKEMRIENCVNRGSVTSGSEAVGGITGYSAAFMTACSNYGNVKGVGKSVGGLVGSQRCAGAVTESHNFGSVICNPGDDNKLAAVGGIVGLVTYPGSDAAYPQRNIIEIDNCTNSGSIMASGENSFGVGGIAGIWDMMGKVNNCTNTALLISGERGVAGIIGSSQWPLSGELVPNGAEEMLYLTNNTSATTLDQMTGSMKNQLLHSGDADKTSLTNNSPEE